MLLGCIGDDFTGSSDLANTLAKAGMAVVQYSGVPSLPAESIGRSRGDCAEIAFNPCGGGDQTVAGGT